MDANVSISGNLGTEVDFISKDGWSGGRFRIAQTPRYFRDGQWVDGETTWLSGWIPPEPVMARWAAI